MLYPSRKVKGLSGHCTALLAKLNWRHSCRLFENVREIMLVLIAYLISNLECFAICRLEQLHSFMNSSTRNKFSKCLLSFLTEHFTKMTWAYSNMSRYFLQ